ncbi:MAG TPA: hypothetical protein VMU53_11700 [Candidatus Sulfotelmatobacter sp.]|nr:hypothetical protein [Candidatus Sulfotelmatobacter sp.]
MSRKFRVDLAVLAAAFLMGAFARNAVVQSQSAPPKTLTWHTLEFAIVRYNENAPNSWNIYHSEKKGVLLVRLWKRYLLVNVQDQEVFDIDPEKIKVLTDAVELSVADIPDQPIETPDFVERNVGSMDRVRFRLGKNGHFLELQLPLGLNGRPIY